MLMGRRYNLLVRLSHNEPKVPNLRKGVQIFVLIFAGRRKVDLGSKNKRRKKEDSSKVLQ